jgi:hypothetical protein
MRRITVSGDTKSQISGAESDPLAIDLAVFDRVYGQYASGPVARPFREKHADFPGIDLSVVDAVPDDGKDGG